MRVLVTGGAGFIGSHIANRFLSKGWEVVVLDSLEETSDINRLDKGIDVIIKERMEKVKILPIVDLVVNSAAETHVDNSISDPKSFVKTNKNLSFDSLSNILQTKI